MLVFSMSADMAAYFWELVTRYRLETEKERTMLLIQLIKTGYPISASETQRTKEQYIKDMSREFTVLDVSKEDIDNERN